MGTLGGAPVIRISRVLTPPQVFATLPAFGFVADDLVVGVNILGNAADDSVNIDNIVVSATPEPATLGLLATGLALLGLAYRRRPG